jgi:7,8-dihydro-6-hydroxymethylpterin dimethyltransferase
VTYAFIDGETITPLLRIVNVYDYLDYITNRVLPDFSLEVRTALEGLWSSPSVAGSQKSIDQLNLSCEACCSPEALKIGDIANSMIMIMLQDFMDPWTFNQKNLMKCCKEFLLPGGKQIPFCAYQRYRLSRAGPHPARSARTRAGSRPQRRSAVRDPANYFRI